MPRGVDQLDSAVRGALCHEWAEVVRAKRAISEILADGKPHGIQKLQACLIIADGLPLAAAHGDKLQLATADDIESVVTRSQPLIARFRLALAATDALLDLQSQGVVVEVAESPVQAEGHPLVGGGGLNIPYQLVGYSASLYVRPPLPNLSPAYRLAPRLVAQAPEWLFDPDLFTADLEGLRLERRALRCIAESLAAYRQGSYLASASLLGAASEGAWYAAGEQLRDLDGRLASALDGEDTVKVMNRVGEVLRQHSRLGTVIDELVAQAALLRQLRNYGVHPRSGETDHLERYFTDSATALLLIEGYSYFIRLADAVTARLAMESGVQSASGMPQG